MMSYCRPKLSDFHTLCQTKLLKNHTLHSGTERFPGGKSVRVPQTVEYPACTNSLMRPLLHAVLESRRREPSCKANRHILNRSLKKNKQKTYRIQKKEGETEDTKETGETEEIGDPMVFYIIYH